MYSPLSRGVYDILRDVVRNTSSGQNPLILSKHAFELTLLSIIVEVMIGRDSLTMPKSLYGISVEHGVGLQFMKELLGTLQKSNLDWLRTELSDGEMVLPLAEIPKPGIRRQELQQFRKQLYRPGISGRDGGLPD